MEKHQLSVRRTARYLTLGQLNDNTRRIWFVLHGYGQLAEYFLPKFELLNDGQTFIIAPEALSRFYLTGMGGSDKVGATWMTREDRLNEIDDYVHYLNTLYHTLLGDTERTEVRIGLLGFSQGVATACRWMASGKFRFDQLVLWAGTVPDDITALPFWERLKEVETQLVYGKKDPLIKPEDVTEQVEKLQKLGVSVRLVPFDGKHEIIPGVVVKVCGG